MTGHKCDYCQIPQYGQPKHRHQPSTEKEEEYNLNKIKEVHKGPGSLT